MSESNELGKIVPFKQEPSFYVRKGREYLQKNEFVKALSYMRKAYSMQPKSFEAAMGVAETLNRMQCYEESARILLLVDAQIAPSEVLFGLASNYIAMEEFEAAKQCLIQYLTNEPNGEFADEAEDYLELLEDDDELAVQMGLPKTDDVKLIDHIHFAKSMHFSGRDEEGKQYLLNLEQTYPQSSVLQTEIALFQYNLKEYTEAEQRLFGLLKKDKRSIRVLCLIALIQYTLGKEAEALETMSLVSFTSTTGTDELSNAATLFLQLQQYEKAEAALNRLLYIVPYDKLALHQMGYCKCYLGDIKQAEAIYQLLHKMNENDTVAAYYLDAVRSGDPNTNKRMMISYEVPYSELLRRLKYLRNSLNDNEHKASLTWQNDPEFRRLIRWSLTSQLSPIRDQILLLLASVGGEEAEYVLRDFLLRMDQPDTAKKDALAALNNMNAKAPFCLYLNGRWQYSIIQPLNLPESLPVSYEMILEAITDVPVDNNMPQNTPQIAARIYFYYIAALEGDFPRISQKQEVALAAAFVLMALHAQQDPRTADDVCEVFGVSMRRLNNALTKIFTCLEKSGKGPPCDS